MNNAHVVDGTANITVASHDGTRFPTELIGGDPRGRTSRCSMLEISI
jgi:S1-C subfamily serine protease